MTLFFRNKKNTAAQPAPKEPEQVRLKADDDLMFRAEKIVYLLGFRGCVGDAVLVVYKTFKIYERLDREMAEQNLKAEP